MNSAKPTVSHTKEAPFSGDAMPGEAFCFGESIDNASHTGNPSELDEAVVNARTTSLAAVLMLLVFSGIACFFLFQ